MKKLLHFLTSRVVLVTLLIVLQFALLAYVVLYLSVHALPVYVLMQCISLLLVVWVISREDNPSYKLAWVVTILALPIFGGLFYLIFGSKRLSRSLKKQVVEFNCTTARHIHVDSGVAGELEEISPSLGAQARYLKNGSGFPVWKDTLADYYPLGEDFWPALLLALQSAQRFILLEYFILQEGEMWNSVLNILREKAAQGVEVLLLYDDMGCIQTLPPGYDRTLREMGLQVTVFNPYRPHLNMVMNYRDHRKICVVDGNIGFCGGINLADEYINAFDKHGHWKDTAVRLEGDGVWNLTLMFLSLWQFSNPQEQRDFSRYVPTCSCTGAAGFVQPFGDSPLDGMNISENAYLQMISRANNYVYITTPYLILDNEMFTALSIAAQSGVDVRILTPHIPDKWFVHELTRSYYQSLLRRGVKIYEYTPGFIHAKMFVSDDCCAIVGTANMDYRSFYLHFECGVAFFYSPVVADVRRDIESTLEKCKMVTYEEIQMTPLPRRIFRAFLKIFAPLM